MDIKLRNSIIGGVALISFSITSYFLYFLPKQSQLDNLIGCNEAGQKMYAKDIQQHEQYRYFEPKFTFSKKLNTCIYKGGYSYSTIGLGALGVGRSDFIRDVYSNTYLAEFGFSGNDNTFGDRDAYDKLNKELFGVEIK